MTAKRTDWPFTKLNLSILGIREGAEWRAIILDMDLEAFGRSFAEAVHAAVDLVDSQIAFAMQKSQPELVLKSSEPMYWQIYHEERTRAMRRLVNAANDDRTESTVEIGSVPVPPLHAQGRSKPFRRAYAA